MVTLDEYIVLRS